MEAPITPDELADSRIVLSHYPSVVANLDWTPLGSAGGFSGAAIWRGDLAGQPAFCLKAWPSGYPTHRLEAAHRWMAQARSTGLVSGVLTSLPGGSVVEHADRVWDVTAWMPGVADFHRNPTDARLAAACAALAALHRCWASADPPFAPCPGVLRRLAVLNEFTQTLAHPIEPRIVDPVWETALDLLQTRVPIVLAELAPWAGRPGPIFPCLCDIWHDHVLFAGDRVSGIIDYGAMKMDHPAVDLARLLGDFVDGNTVRIQLGLDGYRDAGGPVEIDPRLVSILDHSGLVCAVIHWFRRFDRLQPCDMRIIERIKRLVARLADI